MSRVTTSLKLAKMTWTFDIIFFWQFPEVTRKLAILRFYFCKKYWNPKMAKNTTTSGVNQNFELVAPVKILVKPGFSGTEEATSSLRRRSITSIPLNETFSGSCPTAGRGENENIFRVNDQVHSSRNEEERMEISIQIENQVVCDVRNVAYYLRHCFRLMYYTGMSTYNPEKIGNGREETWMDTILIYIQKVLEQNMKLTFY